MFLLSDVNQISRKSRMSELISLVRSGPSTEIIFQVFVFDHIFADVVALDWMLVPSLWGELTDYFSPEAFFSSDWGSFQLYHFAGRYRIVCFFLVL